MNTQFNSNVIWLQLEYKISTLVMNYFWPGEWTWKGVDEMRETLAELNMKITMFLHSDLEYIFILEGN